jgi:hypothetical protein
VQLTACCQVHFLKDTDVANYFNEFPDFKKITSFNGHEVDRNAVYRYIKFTAPGIKWPKSQKLVANDEIRSTFLSDSSFVTAHDLFGHCFADNLSMGSGVTSASSKSTQK